MGQKDSKMEEDVGNDPVKAVHTLKKTSDMLEKKINHVEGKILQLKKNAIEAKKKGDKRKAINFMKKMKLIEKQSDNLYKQKTTIETQIITMETAIGNVEVVEALNVARTAMAHMMQKYDIDKIDEIMGELDEMRADMDEIGELLGQNNMDFDEDELEQELNEIEEQEKQGLLMAQAPNLPKLPAGLLKPQNSDEELAALMNEDKAKDDEEDKLLAELMA